mmetsp:Transcript_4262/g.8696  ORF Transcript_4262/g.8696 Transcript_4262/m.8696 type:complete len:204 (+) Transcript_4262:1552-2163(+)
MLMKDSHEFVTRKHLCHDGSIGENSFHSFVRSCIRRPIHATRHCSTTGFDVFPDTKFSKRILSPLPQSYQVKFCDITPYRFICRRRRRRQPFVHFDFVIEIPSKHNGTQQSSGATAADDRIQKRQGFIIGICNGKSIGGIYSAPKASNMFIIGSVVTAVSADDAYAAGESDERPRRCVDTIISIPRNGVGGYETIGNGDMAAN